MVVVGTTTINAGSGNVGLTNASNNFSLVNVTGGAVAVTDTNNMTITSASGTSIALIAGGTGNTLTVSAFTAGETISVADLSGGVTVGPLSGAMVTAGSMTGSPPVFSGPANWTMATTVSTSTTLNVTAAVAPVVVAATTTPTTSVMPGVTVAEFIENFQAALQAQQDSADAPDKAKDTLVVEGDICRP
jgi:hypothetical protein